MPKRFLFSILIWILLFGFPAVRANQPPVWSPLTDMVVPVGQLLQFLVSATDPEGQPISYTVYQLPVGAGFNSDNKVFSWTPVNGQERSYEVVFRASDDTATADLKVNIIVGNGAAEPAPTPTAGPTQNDTAAQTAQIAATISPLGFLNGPWLLGAIVVLLLVILALLVIILRRR